MDREFPSANRITDRRMSVAEAAYFAGFIDGEGTITIVRTNRTDGRRLPWQYQPCFSVANSDLALLLSLRETCGNGRIKSNYHKKAKAYHRTVYQLKFWAHQARHILPQVVPYLRGKKRQAELLLQYLEHTKKTDGRAKSLDYWQTVENMRVQITNLNPRGDVTPDTPDLITLGPSRQGVNQFTKDRAIIP